jgi:hypothetical protein
MVATSARIFEPDARCSGIQDRSFASRTGRFRGDRRHPRGGLGRNRPDAQVILEPFDRFRPRFGLDLGSLVLAFGRFSERTQFVASRWRIIACEFFNACNPGSVANGSEISYVGLTV